MNHSRGRERLSAAGQKQKLIVGRCGKRLSALAMCSHNGFHELLQYSSSPRTIRRARKTTNSLGKVLECVAAREHGRPPASAQRPPLRLIGVMHPAQDQRRRILGARSMWLAALLPPVTERCRRRPGHDQRHPRRLVAQVFVPAHEAAAPACFSLAYVLPEAPAGIPRAGARSPWLSTPRSRKPTSLLPRPALGLLQGAEWSGRN